MYSNYLKPIVTIVTFIIFISNTKANIIEDIRIWESPDHTRIVLDSTKPLVNKYKVFTLKNPNRVIVNIDKNTLSKVAKEKIAKYINKSRIKKIRYSFNKKLHIVFDTKNSYKLDYFHLKPNKKYSHYRLVIDLYDKKIKSIITENKKIIIIDPGHGGEDPGAIGENGLKEKDIVLNIAKKLANILNKNDKYKAVLTRKGDYYVPLVKRLKLAKELSANLFISIHADAATRKTARGSSIYLLSNKGSQTKLAKELEQQLNTSDVFGGVSQITHNDRQLENILIDLSKSNKEKLSVKLANSILKNIKKISTLHKEKIQRANFVVLKSPIIPSLLLEVAFISNKKEEEKLRTSYYQKKISEAIAKGIKNYYKIVQK